MVDILVQELSRDGAGWTFQVTVSDADSRTRHRVSLSLDSYQQLAGDACDPATLVHRSFEFLLEREPKESILRQFDLPLIGRYFPEYEREIRRRVDSRQ